MIYVNFTERLVFFFLHMQLVSMFQAGVINRRRVNECSQNRSGQDIIDREY